MNIQTTNKGENTMTGALSPKMITLLGLIKMLLWNTFTKNEIQEYLEITPDQLEELEKTHPENFFVPKMEKQIIFQSMISWIQLYIGKDPEAYKNLFGIDIYNTLVDAFIRKIVDETFSILYKELAGNNLSKEKIEQKIKLYLYKNEIDPTDPPKTPEEFIKLIQIVTI